MSNTTAAWLAAANPFRAPATREEALRSARWASFALILSVATSLLFAAISWLNRDQFAATMTRFMEVFAGAGGGSPEDVEMQAAIMEGMMSGMALQQVIWAAVFAVIYLILAKVQWDKPNPWIPAVFLAFAAFGVLGAVGDLIVSASFASTAAALPDGVVMPGMLTREALGIPPWLTAVMAASNTLAIVLHSAAIRGSLALKQMATT